MIEYAGNRKPAAAGNLPVLRELNSEAGTSIGALCRRYRARRLEVFGSAATGDYRPGTSDLDFLVEFDPVLRESYPDTYFGLSKV